jgi:peptidoglycan hydrolase CwlO-like protein
MRIYKKLHYDAVGVGPLDLSGGIDLLRTDIGKSLPWISANILDKQGKPLFRSYINKNLQNVAIAITALTGISKRIPKDVVIAEWENVLPELLSKMEVKGKDTFIILLSTLTTAENRAIAERFPNINLIIGADSHQRNNSPKLYNNALLTQTEKQGKYQGVLEILFGTERKWGQERGKELADLQNNLGSLNWQLRRLQKRAATAEKKDQYTKSITRLQSEKSDLEKKIKTLQESIANEELSESEPDRFEYRFIALKKNMANDHEIEDMLKRLNQQIRQLHKKRPAPANQSAAAKKQQANTTLAGSAACRECHARQFTFWKQTAHSRAYDTLVAKEKNLNLDCLPCHVTQDLYSSEVNLELPDKAMLRLPTTLLSVGCETCHSPGKRHISAPEQFQMAARVKQEICLTCHTGEHDDNFIYETKLQKISCPAG